VLPLLPVELNMLHIVLSLFLANSQAEIPFYNLVIYVVDETGLQVAGAKAEVRTSGGRTILSAATTDECGAVRLALAPGRYDVTLSVSGFASQTLHKIRVPNTRALKPRERPAALAVALAVYEPPCTSGPCM
jgi:hypothetical protein